MKKPDLLIDSDKYFLLPEDFQTSFERNIFSAIFNLYQNGATRINSVDVDNYLKNIPGAYNIFQKNNGIEYLNDCEELSNIANFDYYYNKLKKLNCLRDLKKMGFSVDKIYSEEISEEAKKINERFETLTISDIIEICKKGISGIENKYNSKYTNTDCRAGDGIDELIEQFKTSPEVGANLPGDIFNTIVRGARKGKFYLKSAASGAGKAIPNYTVIPTPNGFKRVDEVKVGDYLFDAFGKPTKVLGVYPQGKKEVYEITFKDGRKAECCSEHLWSFNTATQRNSTKTNRKFNTESLSKIMSMQLQNNNGEYTILIPNNYAVEYTTKDFSINPYVFGLLLGDGSFRTNKNCMTFSSENEELPSYIANIMNWEYKKSSEKNFDWVFLYRENNKINGRTRIYCEDLLINYPELINTYSSEKFIPKDYLYGDIQQRLDLLNGLLDADGSVDNKGRVSYYTNSEQLSKDVIGLCQSLGFKASCSLDTHKETSSVYCIRITGRPEDKIKLFKLERKKKVIQDWFNNKKRKENNNYNAIVSIKKTNRLEEMTCFYVDNKEHLFLMNDYIVTHNTRGLVGDACALAYPIRYNSTTCRWEQHGDNQKILYIVTEQDDSEIKSLILSYLSDVNEEKILYNTCTLDESIRIMQAAQVMKQYIDNFHIVKLSDPTITEIKAKVRKYYFEENIEAFFYDYIFSSPGILNEFRDLKIREDVVLNMLSTSIKDLASDLGIFAESATQLNRGDNDSKTGVKNQNNVRGAISIVDKCDVASIFARTIPEEITALEPFISKYGRTPNQVLDIYKVRRGRFTNVRIWSYFDYGTCRKYDLFITNGDYTPVDEFTPVIFMNRDVGNYHELLDKLNNMNKTQTEKPKEEPKTEAPVVVPKKQYTIEETLSQEGVDFF